MRAARLRSTILSPLRVPGTGRKGRGTYVRSTATVIPVQAQEPLPETSAGAPSPATTVGASRTNIGSPSHTTFVARGSMDVLHQESFDCKACGVRFMGAAPIEESKRKEATLCGPCGLLVSRWTDDPSNPGKTAVREEDVATFAALNPVHASWLVWLINSKRKKHNAKGTRTKLVGIEKKRQPKSSEKPARLKLLNLNKTLALCKK